MRESSSSGGGDRGKPRFLSRRGVLYAAAATGAAAASGSGVAALLGDTERVSAALTAGTLDLDVAVQSPVSWRNGPYTGSLVLHEPQSAEFELTVDTNPAYVWLVSPCPTCESVESTVAVTLELTRPGAGTSTLFSGTLEAFRAAYGTGQLLATRALSGNGETWLVTFTWELLEPLAEGVDVAFGFEFRAIQERNLGDPTSFDLGLPACNACEEPPECGKSISFVAFCGDQPIDEADLSFARVECGDSGDFSTLAVTAIPTHVDHVLLKYGTKLDVFRYDGESTPFGVTTGGDGDLTLVATYDSQGHGNEYPESGDPPRRNDDPCPGEHWVKFDGFGDDPQ